jgi:hypothetical protein
MHFYNKENKCEQQPMSRVDEEKDTKMPELYLIKFEINQPQQHCGQEFKF